MDQPTVSLAVLNYNGREWLGPCLDSLKLLRYPKDRLELVVCDNGSTDGSLEYLGAEHPDVRVLALDHNHGFAEGNNRAAAFARNELIGFLNNDMRADPGWLETMVQALSGAPGAGCVSSKILSWDGSTIDFAGAGISFQGFGFQFDAGRLQARSNETRRIMCPCGGAMLMPRALFLEVGGFDSDYFAFYEDTDLGWRLNLLGHDVWYVPDAVVYHHHHGTAARLSDHERRFLYERNALFTMYKCLDDENLAAALPASLLLTNEKSLQLARAVRDSVRPDLPPSSEAPLPPLRRRVAAAWSERGVIGVAAHARAFGARRLSRASERFGRWWETHVPSRFRTDAEPPRDPLESLAVQVAVAEFARSLEPLRRKREWVQTRRARSDAELLPLFHFATEPSFFEEPYVGFHELLVRVLGLDRRFGAGQLHVPD